MPFEVVLVWRTQQFFKGVAYASRRTQLALGRLWNNESQYAPVKYQN